MPKTYSRRAPSSAFRKKRTYKKKYVKRHPLPMSAMPRAMRPEVKKNDATKINNFTCEPLSTGNAPVQRLIGLAQGAADGQYAGDSIFLKYIHLRCLLYGSTSQTTGAWVRLAVIRDNKPSITTAQTVPAASYIFSDQGGDQERSMMSPLNPDVHSRFTIVKQRYMYFPTYISSIPNVISGASTQTNTQKMLNFKLKVNRRVEISTAYNTPVDGCDYYLVAFGNVTTNEVKCVVASRLYYTDC